MLTPEWPALAVVRRRLAGLAGRRVRSADAPRPLVLLLPVEGPLDRLLAGQTLTSVEQRGKFLTLRCGDGSALVVNPMLTGAFSLKRRAGACLRLTFEDGTVLGYVDPKQMGKAYDLPPGHSSEADVPGYAGMGPEPGPGQL